MYGVGKVLVHLFTGIEYLEHVYMSNIAPLEVGMFMEGWTKEGHFFWLECWLWTRSNGRRWQSRRRIGLLPWKGHLHGR